LAFTAPTLLLLLLLLLVLLLQAINQSFDPSVLDSNPSLPINQPVPPASSQNPIQKASSSRHTAIHYNRQTPIHLLVLFVPQSSVSFKKVRT